MVNRWAQPQIYFTNLIYLEISWEFITLKLDTHFAALFAICPVENACFHRIHLKLSLFFTAWLYHVEIHAGLVHENISRLESYNLRKREWIGHVLNLDYDFIQTGWLPFASRVIMNENWVSLQLSDIEICCTPLRVTNLDRNSLVLLNLIIQRIVRKEHHSFDVILVSKRRFKEVKPRYIKLIQLQEWILFTYLLIVSHLNCIFGHYSVLFEPHKCFFFDFFLEPDTLNRLVCRLNLLCLLHLLFFLLHLRHVNGGNLVDVLLRECPNETILFVLKHLIVFPGLDTDKILIFVRRLKCVKQLLIV